MQNSHWLSGSPVEGTTQQKESFPKYAFSAVLLHSSKNTAQPRTLEKMNPPWSSPWTTVAVTLCVWNISTKSVMDVYIPIWPCIQPDVPRDLYSSLLAQFLDLEICELYFFYLVLWKISFLGCRLFAMGLSTSPESQWFMVLKLSYFPTPPQLLIQKEIFTHKTSKVF